MNKRLFSFIIVATISLGIFCSISFSNNDTAPPGRTGAPGENSCGAGTNGCHNSMAAATPNLGLTLKANGIVVDDNFEYEAGNTYNMEFSIDNPSQRNGFSLTTLNTADTFVGNFSIPTGSDAEIRTSNPLSRTYVGHTNTLNTNSWLFDWTAPTGETSVTVYASANISNNNGNRSNDTIVPFVKTIALMTSDTTSPPDTTSLFSINTIEEEVIILQNPITSNQLILDLTVKQPKAFTFEIYGIDGKQISPAIETIYHGGVQRVILPFEATSEGLYILKIATASNQISTYKLLKKR